MIRKFFTSFTSFLLFGLFIFGNLHAEESQTASSSSSAETKPHRELPLANLNQGDPSKVEVLADSLEYSKDADKIIGKGNVTINYENTQLTADYAEVETGTKKAFARGHVVIFKSGAATAYGDEVNYDFKSGSGSFPDGRSFNFPWFTTGQDFYQPQNGVKIIKRGSLTSCNLEHPHYEIKAKKITVYEGDKLIARNVTFYILGKPVFWVPILILPLQEQNLPFGVNTGYNSKYGYFLELTKGYSLMKQVFGKLHFDWRSKRGFGSGGDVDYDFGKWGRGGIDLYLTKDKRSPTPGLENPYSELQDELRGRITVRHRTDFNPDSHLILRYNRLADEYFLQDFFEKEYRSEIEPQSFISFTKNSNRFGFLAHAQKRMNRFESTVEQLPHLQFDVRNQPIYKNLFYESQTSYSGLAKRFGRSEINEHVNRADQFDQISLPKNWNNIKFTPFANLRNTIYSREKSSYDNRFRMVFGWGTDIRTHWYKTFPTTFDKWGIEVNQLRHVVEPLFQYQSIKSTLSDERLNQFDSKDRLDDSDIFTFGIENRLQTKRVVNGKMQRVDFVSMNTFLSLELYPDGRSLGGLFAPFEDGRESSGFTILGQEVVLRPYNWLQYEIRTNFDIQSEQFQVFNQDFNLKFSKFNLIFGHRYITDLPGIDGSNQFIFDGKYKINSLWEAGGYTRWDSATMELEEWQLMATRDLHDFILDIGYNVRNSSIDNANKTLFFDLRLKALPMLHIAGGNNHASFEAPRIGETVAGANQSGT